MTASAAAAAAAATGKGGGGGAAGSCKAKDDHNTFEIVGIEKNNSDVRTKRGVPSQGDETELKTRNETKVIDIQSLLFALN